MFEGTPNGAGKENQVVDEICVFGRKIFFCFPEPKMAKSHETNIVLKNNYFSTPRDLIFKGGYESL